MTEIIVTISGCARLAREGVFPVRDELLGVTEHGAAIYAYEDTVVVRPAGPRPGHVRPFRARSLGK